MTANVTTGLIALSLFALAGCGNNDDNSIRFEYAGTTMDTCAETSIGFHPDSVEITPTAETILFDTVDHLGVDCVGASIDITAYRGGEAEGVANSRAHAVEASILDNYDVSDSRISKTVGKPPAPEEGGRVHVALMVEVPLEE
ncbi:hypothetical protein WNY37_06040 [Henriciella sp. AS95]|uniref:hypothetical protein n=1 Tax=Henriciella sp. AS95 TaxID=3135782 RepID=UPI00317DCC3E